MDISILNEICNTGYLPRTKFTELKKNTMYLVTRISKVASSFAEGGQAVVVELNDPFKLFYQPERVIH